MKILELFCGTKSISKVFNKNGWETTTLDFDAKFNPTICSDILTVDITDQYDVIWASPPCTCFSVASIGRHWRGGCPSKEAIIGNKILAKTLEIINIVRPKYWFIENPRGMMRTLPIMKSLPYKTVTYCQYGDTRMKPTDIFTNCLSWNPKPPCKNGDNCHESAPRGSKTGTQGIDNSVGRGVIPEKLCEEIFESVAKGTIKKEYEF
ncbi:MAG: DNA cytosine methyltransferase [Candidatus Magnetobacterium sp. LHC-1]